MKYLAAIAVIGFATLGPSVALAQLSCPGGVCTNVRTSAQAGNQPQDIDGGNGFTSSHSESNFTGAQGFSNNNSSADVATGAIHVFTDTQYSGGATGAISEYFTFNFGPGVTGPQDIGVSWTVEGVTDYRDTQPFGSASGNGANFQIQGFGGTDSVTFGDLNFTFGSAAHNAFIAEGDYHRTFTDTLTVLAGQLFRVDTFIQVAVTGNGMRDFGNTSFFNFSLPTGVTLVSGSGLLLTNPVTSGAGSIPEPASWALMILGFASLGAALRRRTLAKL